MSHSSVCIPRLTTVQLPTTMGLDLSDRVSHFHVILGDGRTLSSGKVVMTHEALGALFEQWKGCRMVIEAGCHSPWVSRLAERCSMDIVVANPRKLDLIAKSIRKSDRTDAEVLAQAGLSNLELLGPVTHRSQQEQAHLAVQRSRNEVVSARTGLINHVRGMLKSFGRRAPACSSSCFHSRALREVPPELIPALQPMLRLIGVLSEQIRAFDKEIERLGGDQYPITKLLRQVGGVGPILSLCFVLTISDPRRFRNSRQVGCYVGLAPRERSSGDSDPQLHITKAGDRELRRLLVLAANYILGRFGPDCDLRRFGLRIAGSGNDRKAKKRARVAVARKLAVLLHRLWITGEVYDPFYLARRRGEPVPA